MISKVNKRYWYIWFSILAFEILWGVTVINLTTHKRTLDFFKDYKRFDLYTRALGQCFFLSIIIIFLPLLILGSILYKFESIFPVLENITPLVLIITLYFLGVYATYRLAVWRQKNLLDENTQR